MNNNRWMLGSLIVLLTLAVWPQAWAARSPQESSGQIYVRNYVAHLNHYFPDLGLAINSADRNKDRIIFELEALENHLQGDQALSPRSLTQLTCSNPICGGGGSGCGRFCHSTGFENIDTL